MDIRRLTVSCIAAATILLGVALPAVQTPAVRAVDEQALREYTGVYQWGQDEFVYLQLWRRIQRVRQARSAGLRSMNPARFGRCIRPIAISFFAGPGVAVSTAIESRIEFQRDAAGKIISLTWQREGAASTARAARRDREA